MILHDVGFDFIGTSPRLIAEQASALALVFLPHVSIALLGSSKFFKAIFTDGPAPSAHARFFLVLSGCDTLNVGTLTGSMMGLSLGYVIVCSITVKLSGACLVGWKIRV